MQNNDEPDLHVEDVSEGGYGVRCGLSSPNRAGCGPIRFNNQTSLASQCQHSSGMSMCIQEQIQPGICDWCDE
jgi:hypothetical protein